MALRHRAREPCVARHGAAAKRGEILGSRNFRSSTMRRMSLTVLALLAFASIAQAQPAPDSENGKAIKTEIG